MLSFAKRRVTTAAAIPVLLANCDETFGITEFVGPVRSQRLTDSDHHLLLDRPSFPSSSCLIALVAKTVDMDHLTLQQHATTSSPVFPQVCSHLDSHLLPLRCLPAAMSLGLHHCCSHSLNLHCYLRVVPMSLRS